MKKIKLDKLVLKLNYHLKYSKHINKQTGNNTKFTLEEIRLDTNYDLNDAAPIDLTINTILKKPVFDSLFNSNEHINDISIYLIADNTYFIKGKKSMLKLTIIT